MQNNKSAKSTINQLEFDCICKLNSPSTKNLNIEILRGILMLWIVLFHYTTRYNDLFKGTFSYEFENGGQIGVTFFFVISGYFFYKGVINSPLKSVCDVIKFSINKYWRLYPAYLISILLIFIAYQLFNLPGRECSSFDFFINSIFIYHPYFSYVDSAHWFIAILIKLQILSGLFLVLKSKTRNIIILVFELFIFSLLIYANNFPYLLVEKAIIILSPDCFLKFLLGYNLYMAINNCDKTKYLHICIGTIIIGYYCFTIHTILVLIYTIVTILVLHNKFIPSIQYKYNPLLIIGKYSFTWYLIHQNIGFIIINQLSSWGLTNEYWIIIPMTLTFGVGFIIQNLVNLLPNKIFTK